MKLIGTHPGDRVKGIRRVVKVYGETAAQAAARLRIRNPCSVCFGTGSRTRWNGDKVSPPRLASVGSVLQCVHCLGTGTEPIRQGKSGLQTSVKPSIEGQI